MNRWVYLSEVDAVGDRRVIAYLLTEGEPTAQERTRRLYGACPDTASGDWPDLDPASVEPWTEVTGTEQLVGDDWRRLADGSWAPPEWMEAPSETPILG